MDAKHNLIEQLSNILKPHWATLPPETKKSIVDLTGKINDYLMAIDAASLPEAPASANFRAVHQVTQAEVQFTLRGRSFSEINDKVMAALNQLVDTGWQTFDQYVDQRRAERGETKAAAPQQQPNQHPQETTQDGGLVCNAKELLAMPKSTSDSTLMWKVMTDKSKYPVAMYEETVEQLKPKFTAAGIDVSQFVVNGQPAKYNLVGWKAVYVLKDGTNFPKKIIDLISIGR